MAGLFAESMLLALVGLVLLPFALAQAFGVLLRTMVGAAWRARRKPE
ncbi:hypothetical protein [Sandaracinobacteroides saxicola]|uniref:Uncharacterized protein n=1 Tax=Sandaracinobacteroides saxicola TaxID=2759707 RepID=A0A7G5IH51_9SPHN|nr:hypothetical protein [Sandaracinobacteroides saxicola]QMW22693.1 hypothetical protein H3309_15525 [Sandaracinobacteroides saxicola]